MVKVAELGPLRSVVAPNLTLVCRRFPYKQAHIDQGFTLIKLVRGDAVTHVDLNDAGR